MTMNKFKNVCDKFAKGTTMHGFFELNATRSMVWKFLWFCVVGVAISVTAYHMVEAIDQFFNRSSSTLIEVAEPDQVFYPPLKVCFSHWIDWVDAERAAQVGFSREAILYGLSFLTTIYSNTSIDVGLAVHNFTEGMNENNLTSVSEFYQKISRRVDNFITFKHQAYGSMFSGKQFHVFELFKKTELVVTEFKLELKKHFCYVADGDDIKEFLLAQKKGADVMKSTSNAAGDIRNILEFELKNEHDNKLELSPEEYNSYMAEWITTTMPEYGTNENPFTMFACYNPYSCAMLDYSAVKPSKVIYLDGFSDIGIIISPETDKYFVGVKGSAHYWKNQSKNKCIAKTRFIVSNSTCSKLCKSSASKAYPVSYESNNVDCSSLNDPSLFLNKLDQPNKLCKNKLYILAKPEPYSRLWIPKEIGSASTEVMQITTFNQVEYEKKAKKLVGTIGHEKQMVSVWANVNFRESQLRAAEEMRKRCVETQCNSGCEKWSFEVNVRTKSLYNTVRTVATKSSTGIQIEYPLDGDILIMREVDSQTWEDFVGIVGGLLGIWLGATILSFIQMVYLCCSSLFDGGVVKSSVTKIRPRIMTPKPTYLSQIRKY